jgi:hypothetical protein
MLIAVDENFEGSRTTAKDFIRLYRRRDELLTSAKIAKR